MNIWTALRRIFSEHFVHHMVIPLVVGALGVVVVVAFRKNVPFLNAADELLQLEHLIPLLLVIVAYLFVMLIIVTRETTTPFETANYTIVEQQLKQATSYFALCAIPMREWFEPGAFKYFALLVSKKQSGADAFRYKRVLIFPRAAPKRHAEATILDRHHAQALATAHVTLDIPMGWLGPRELRQILSKMSPDHRLRLMRVPAALRWVPSLASRLPLQVELDFAIIERVTGPKAVILFPFKKSEAIVLEGQEGEAFQLLGDAVKKKVFEEDGTIKEDHNFPHLLAT